MVTFYQDCSSHHDSSKNMAPPGMGMCVCVWGGGGVLGGGGVGARLIFPIYLYGKLYKSSCEKLLYRFQYNTAEMPGGRAYFPYISI